MPFWRHGFLLLPATSPFARVAAVPARRAAAPGRLVETLALRPAGGGGGGFLLEASAPQAPTFNAWLSWAPDERRFAFVSNGGEESACGWCKDRWGISWQITPRVLTDALAVGGAEAKRAFAAMMDMGRIGIAKIEAARRG